MLRIARYKTLPDRILVRTDFLRTTGPGHNRNEVCSPFTPHRSLLLVWRQGRVNTTTSMGK
jgi:hypothetical protein